ncbi:hypothetical protein LCGC14_1479060 [marine sediment metagenome]|uniref:Uncharacterized protein n=1 Tax=marine sediment metagenome TaxID=412755 RepID=A0A0F9JAP7_9ZZZZ
MTKKVDEFFDLPPLEDALAEQNADKLECELEEVSNTLVNLPRNAGILANVMEDQHDRETEEIRKKAIALCDEVAEVARNVNPERSARLFEVAGQMLKTGLDAANSKSEKQLKAAKLKLEARRLKIDDELIGEISHGKVILADRNALLKQLVAESRDNIVDVELKED